MKLLWVLSLLVQLIISVRAGETDIAPTVSMGSLANLFEIHYQVSVQHSNQTGLYPFQHICGGVVVSVTSVLTAGHCLYTRNYQMRPQELRVVSDTLSSNTTGMGQVRNVQKIVWQKKFNLDTRDNNLAILILTNEFNVTMTLRPIPLRTSKVQTGETCVVSGFGGTDFNGQITNQLRRVTVQTSKFDSCKKSYAKNTITKRMICTGPTFGGGCKGDDGGPLVCYGQLTGIITFDDCRGGSPSVYTEVAPHAEWIMRNRAAAGRQVTLVGTVIMTALALVLQ